MVRFLVAVYLGERSEDLFPPTLPLETQTMRIVAQWAFQNTYMNMIAYLCDLTTSKTLRRLT